MLTDRGDTPRRGITLVDKLGNMTRVALIDDHESVRLGLEAACARAGKIVVFSGPNVSEYVAWRAASGASPADVVVLDLTLGDGSSVTTNVRTVVADGSSVIFHIFSDLSRAVLEALDPGAADVVSKISSTEYLILTI